MLVSRLHVIIHPPTPALTYLKLDILGLSRLAGQVGWILTPSDWQLTQGVQCHDVWAHGKARNFPLGYFFEAIPIPESDIKLFVSQQMVVQHYVLICLIYIKLKYDRYLVKWHWFFLEIGLIFVKQQKLHLIDVDLFPYEDSCKWNVKFLFRRCFLGYLTFVLKVNFLFLLAPATLPTFFDLFKPSLLCRLRRIKEDHPCLMQSNFALVISINITNKI